MIKSNDFSYPEYFIHLHYLLSIFHYPLSIILFPGCYPPPRHSFPSSSSQSFSVQGSKLHQTQGKDKLLLLFISLLIILAAMYILGFENLKRCCLPKYFRPLEQAERQLEFLLVRALHPQVPLGRGINARCIEALYNL